MDFMIDEFSIHYKTCLKARLEYSWGMVYRKSIMYMK